MNRAVNLQEEVINAIKWKEEKTPDMEKFVPESWEMEDEKKLSQTTLAKNLKWQQEKFPSFVRLPQTRAEIEKDIEESQIQQCKDLFT